MGWGWWVWVVLALAVLTVAAILVAAVVGVLLVTHLDYNYIMRLSLYYVGVGYFNVFPACPSICTSPAVSPNAPLILLRPYRVETVTVGNRTVMRFIGPYGGPWYDPGAAFVGVIRVTVGLSLSNESVPPLASSIKWRIPVAYQWDIFPTRSITIPRVIPVNVSTVVNGVGRVVAVGNVTFSGVGCFVPVLVQYMPTLFQYLGVGGYRFRYFNQTQYSFCIPSSAEFSGTGVTPELATWAIQNALKPVLNRAYGAVLEVLETLPPVKRYVGDGELVLVQESIAVSWNGTRAKPEYIFYVFGFNVIAPNGTRIGIVGVSLNLIPMGGVFPPGYIYLHINLVPKTYVQALNRQQQNTTNTLFNPS